MNDKYKHRAHAAAFLASYVGHIAPIEKVVAGIDFESDEPLVCDPNRPDAETCESCQ